MPNQGSRYKEDFKKQLVELVNNGKKISDISREYGMSETAVYEWVKKYNNTGSFKASDNRTEEENELIRLQKRNKQLEMEVDILKQAALIMGRK